MGAVAASSLMTKSPAVVETSATYVLDVEMVIAGDLDQLNVFTRVAVDVSGRPCLVFRTEFPTPKMGTFDTELVREWFQAFAMNAGVTLHVETLYGDNDHHICESCFKGLARALRAAVAIDPRRVGEIPSTKGTLAG